ncbi:hypothetical protein QBC40DRAFT_302380 [Triangularia verruculosa]|uniref:Uncharacterized protein n=1 Tax=Triangularia verruculosa TaxID=2587418 RepID=A0AAN6X5A2_9PEZI|nr:hypothetical protein QBC40DRAFT_302380 [Triangularia verruculosa]
MSTHATVKDISDEPIRSIEAPETTEDREVVENEAEIDNNASKNTTPPPLGNLKQYKNALKTARCNTSHISRLTDIRFAFFYDGTLGLRNRNQIPSGIVLPVFPGVNGITPGIPQGPPAHQALSNVATIATNASPNTTLSAPAHQPAHGMPSSSTIFPPASLMPSTAVSLNTTVRPRNRRIHPRRQGAPVRNTGSQTTISPRDTTLLQYIKELDEKYEDDSTSKAAEDQILDESAQR